MDQWTCFLGPLCPCPPCPCPCPCPQYPCPVHAVRVRRIHEWERVRGRGGRKGRNWWRKHGADTGCVWFMIYHIFAVALGENKKIALKWKKEEEKKEKNKVLWVLWVRQLFIKLVDIWTRDGHAVANPCGSCGWCAYADPCTLMHMWKSSSATYKGKNDKKSSFYSSLYLCRNACSWIGSGNWIGFSSVWMMKWALKWPLSWFDFLHTVH